MKFRIKSLLVFLLLLSWLFYTPLQVKAANSCNLTFSGSGSDAVFDLPDDKLRVSATNAIFEDNPITADGEYVLNISRGNPFFATVDIPSGALTNGTLSEMDVSSQLISIFDNFSMSPTQTQNVTVELRKRDPASAIVICGDNFLVRKKQTVTTQCTNNSFQFAPIINGNPSLGTQVNSSHQVRLIIDSAGTSGFVDGTYNVFLERTDSQASGSLTLIDAAGGQLVATVPRDSGPHPAGQYQVVVTGAVGDSTRYCVVNNSTFTIIDKDAPGASGDPFELCKQAGTANYSLCNTCFENNGIWTAIGCIPYKTASGDATGGVTLMIRSLMTIGLGIAGGVVVLMVLAGSFLLSTSQGDPKRVEEGKSLISSAVIGILFVIFSVTILRFIGVDVLQIPGFGR